VAAARAAGSRVDVRIPTYSQPTWRGYVPGNQAIYPGWVTPEDHAAVRAAVEAYQRVVAPGVTDAEESRDGGSRSRQPRVDRWIFSTDGVGYQLPVEGDVDHVAEKGWLREGRFIHPPMIGFGPGIEQNTTRSASAWTAGSSRA
jgi:hypothetical protein